MRNSSKDLSVFEFKTDEENEEGSKLSKYHFLEAFTPGHYHLKSPDVSVLPPILPPISLQEVDSSERSMRNLASTAEISELDDVKACSTSYYAHTKTCPSNFRPGNILEEDCFVMGASRVLVASAYDNEASVLQSSDLPVSLVSNEEESYTSSSEASFTSGDLTDSDGHPECLVFEHCHSNFDEMDENKSTVVVCPDYVIYGDQIFLESQLTFCSDCIKIECSEACRTDEKLSLVCDIADVIRICSQRSTSVDALLFKFWIRTTVPGPEKFIASVADILWLEIEPKIMSLAEIYKDIWDTLPDNSYALEDEMPRTHMSFSKRYFTEIVEPFEDVIYPKGDPDAISISKRDIELLEPDTFINDTIIDFYIKYLQDNVPPSEKSRFHFFNCFFFRKLADLDKDPGSISEGKAAYERVRKWTRKLNIFEMDYIFIPVNFNLHWSLLVICHPGEIISFEDGHLKNAPKVPCILHMDSLRGSHKGLEKLIQSYLLEEWKGRHLEFHDNAASRFTNLRFVYLELPQQENATDCGLFLLHYVELFLLEAPYFFNPARIYNFSDFLTPDWFPPSEASYKRFRIRGLLYDILRDSSQKLASNNEDFSSFGNVATDVDQAVEFFSAQNSPSKSVNGSSSMLPHTTQDDVFVQTASFKPSPMTRPLEELGDVNVDAEEHLDEDGKVGSAEMVPIGSAASQVHSTSFYEIPSISGQAKEAVVDSLSTSSNDEPASSNEGHEIRDLASPTVVECPFVPDTPDASNPQQEVCGTSSQEVVNSGTVEVERHDDPETCPTDNEKRTDLPETESGKAEHPPQSDETCGIQEGFLVENLGGGGQEMSSFDEDGEVDDSQEGNVLMERCKEDLPRPQVSVGAETILSDSDVTPRKRNKISGSVQRISKRQKVEQENVGCRMTRSSSRKMGA